MIKDNIYCPWCDTPMEVVETEEDYKGKTVYIIDASCPLCAEMGESPSGFFECRGFSKVDAYENFLSRLDEANQEG